MITENTNVTQEGRRAAPPVNKTDKDARAWQTAREFEALFTSMMFKSMRNTVSEGTLIPKNMGEDFFTEMLDNEYARMNAEKGSMGLAALIVKEMERSEGRAISAPPGMSSNAPLWAMSRHTGSTPRVSKQMSAADSAALIERVRDKWKDLIAKAGKRHGVDESLITAVIARESAGNPRAISNKGAKGLMQLMDGTARDMGVSYSFSPAENINGGVKYLKLMLNTFGGDEKKALAAYNAGPGAVRKHNGIPPYRETIDYVAAVTQLRDTMKKEELRIKNEKEKEQKQEQLSKNDM